MEKNIISSLKDICNEQRGVNPKPLEATVVLTIEIATDQPSDGSDLSSTACSGSGQYHLLRSK